MRINDKENYKEIRNSITMKNLKTIIDSKSYSITKVAVNAKISDSTINAYINGQKIPSLPTLISIANYLDCNTDYLLDRTNNPEVITKIDKKDEELMLITNSLKSLPNNKIKLVEAYIKGLLE